MDPNATFEAILTNLIDAEHGDPQDRQGYKADAIESLRALTEWLEKGGSLPDVHKVWDELA
jgi:hypothetical protein